LGLFFKVVYLRRRTRRRVEGHKVNIVFCFLSVFLSFCLSVFLLLSLKTGAETGWDFLSR
jgi:hypothetical protein